MARTYPLAWADDPVEEGQEEYYVVRLYSFGEGRDESSRYKTLKEARDYAAAYLRRERGKWARGERIDGVRVVKPWAKQPRLSISGKWIEFPATYEVMGGELTIEHGVWPWS